MPEPPWRDPNGVFHTYALNCHCSAIKLHINISPPLFPEHAEDQTDAATGKPETYQPVSCNCSICVRQGTVGVHLPPNQVTFERGFDDLKVYKYGAKDNVHWFCGTCGTYVGADISPKIQKVGLVGVEKWLINLRNLSDYDVDRLEPKIITEMRDMPPKYEAK